MKKKKKSFTVENERESIGKILLTMTVEKSTKLKATWKDRKKSPNPITNP